MAQSNPVEMAAFVVIWARSPRRGPQFSLAVRAEPSPIATRDAQVYGGAAAGAA